MEDEFEMLVRSEPEENLVLSALRDVSTYNLTIALSTTSLNSIALQHGMFERIKYNLRIWLNFI